MVDNNINKKETTIFIDGVFDIMHSGHFNAIRQAKKLGNKLFIGVCEEQSVIRAKGPPLMNDEERFYLVQACKWADKVIDKIPYTPTIEILDSIGADFAAHGDDEALDEHGNDVYKDFKLANRMKIFKRTDGVSTTDMIGRLLMIGINYKIENLKLSNNINDNIYNEKINYNPLTSKFLCTGRRFREFCNSKLPTSSDKVIYIDGMFDILHVGIIEALEKAKSYGSFLYVGIYDDETCKKVYGDSFPVLSLNERTINLLALKFVDDVVIACPLIVNEHVVSGLNISNVVLDESCDFKVKDNNVEIDRYSYPKQQDMVKKIKCKYSLDNNLLIDRIMHQKEKYVVKYLKKAEKEKNYYKTRDLTNIYEI